jgi:hypothetical protein
MSVKLIFTITQEGELTRIDSQSQYDQTSTEIEKLYSEFVADLLRKELKKCEATKVK